MIETRNTNNILSLLNNYTLENTEDIAVHVAESMRKRRIEKNISREELAKLSEIPVATIARFEQKGLISFPSLISLAMALGYSTEIKSIFNVSKFDTMEDLSQIRKNSGKKRAYKRNENTEDGSCERERKFIDKKLMGRSERQSEPRHKDP